MDTWRLLKSWLGQLCYLKSGGTIGLSLLKDDPALLQAAMDSLKDNIKNVLQNRQKVTALGAYLMPCVFIYRDSSYLMPLNLPSVHVCLYSSIALHYPAFLLRNILSSLCCPIHPPISTVSV